MTCCMCNTPTPFESDLVQKIFPTIVGSSIVVLLFIIGRLLDSTMKLREIKRNWYLKVIIDPNIKKLEDFYLDVFSTLKVSISTLVQLKSTRNFNEYIVDKSLEMGKFQTLKRKFELDFIALIQTNYPEISNELENLLRDLEDKVTSYLDRQDLVDSHYDNLEISVSSTKYELLKILYKPLILKRFSLLKNLKFCMLSLLCQV